jgi:hypothetical protein
MDAKAALEPIRVESVVDYGGELDQVIALNDNDVAWIEISDCWKEP